MVKLTNEAQEHFDNNKIVGEPELQSDESIHFTSFSDLGTLQISKLKKSGEFNLICKLENCCDLIKAAIARSDIYERWTELLAKNSPERDSQEIQNLLEDK